MFSSRCRPNTRPTRRKRHEQRSTKPPISKPQGITKSQSSKIQSTGWCLAIGASLEFGVWCFELRDEIAPLPRPQRHFVQGVHHRLARPDDVVLHVLPAAG